MELSCARLLCYRSCCWPRAATIPRKHHRKPPIPSHRQRNCAMRSRPRWTRRARPSSCSNTAPMPPTRRCKTRAVERQHFTVACFCAAGRRHASPPPSLRILLDDPGRRRQSLGAGSAARCHTARASLRFGSAFSFHSADLSQCAVVARVEAQRAETRGAA